MQALLRTLTYVNRAAEPSLVQRNINIFVQSTNDTQSCTILLDIVPVNDNSPQVDLSGPRIPSTNHRVDLNYTFLSGPSSEWISSRDASVSDQDQNGRIESLRAELLPGRPGDRIYLSEMLGCSLDDTTNCLLR